MSQKLAIIRLLHCRAMFHCSSSTAKAQKQKTIILALSCNDYPHRILRYHHPQNVSPHAAALPPEWRSTAILLYIRVISKSLGYNLCALSPPRQLAGCSPVPRTRFPILASQAWCTAFPMQVAVLPMWARHNGDSHSDWRSTRGV